jgi:hypothetical protein
VRCQRGEIIAEKTESNLADWANNRENRGNVERKTPFSKA